MFLQKTILAQFPHLEDIVYYSCQFDLGSYQQGLYQYFDIGMPSCVRHSAVKRQAEFLAGRYSAKKALKQLAIESDIPIGANRNPVWPDNIIGSITHTDDQALSAVTYQHRYEMLGIDCERWLPIKICEDISSTIISKQEETLLKRTPYLYSRLFTLTFSAKESLFKALYPKLGYYFDFLSAAIIEISWQQQYFILRLNIELSDTIKKGDTFKGYFYRSELTITTIIAVPTQQLNM